MPITYFKCAKCLHTFDTHKEARDCEKSHLRPVSAKAIKYTIKPYPYSIEVTFNNGEKHIFNAQDLGG
jgi:hypothetical protein